MPPSSASTLSFPRFSSLSTSTMRRFLLVLLALPLLLLPLLLFLGPEDIHHHHSHYMTLRHSLPVQARPPPLPSLVVPLGTEMPVGGREAAALLDGGGGGEEQDGEIQVEAEAKERETQQGEEETEKMRAREDQQEEEEEQVEDEQVEEKKPRQEPSSSSLSSSSLRSSSSWPPPSWAWPLNEDHQTFGAKRFGIRFPPTAPGAFSSSCAGGSGEEEMDFTLVTQTSPDRLWMLGHICQRWQGPIVLAVFTRGFTAEHDALIDRTYCPQARLLRVRPPQGQEEAEEGRWGSPDQFPVNALRNLAIAEVTTSHFLLTDMDLWPSRYLYPLLKHLSTNPSTQPSFLDPLQAFVVPAFSYFGSQQLDEEKEEGGRDEEEKKRKTKADGMPSDQSSLLRCFQARECIVFDAQYNVHGHGTTDNYYWATRQGPEELKPLPCFHSNRYEPYVVLRRCPTTPPFAEAFTGYGKNKIQHIAHLRMRGFAFSVLPPQAFLVHFPHPTSRSKRSWLDGDNLHRGRMDHLYSDFLDWAFQEKAARAGKITHLCRPAVVVGQDGKEGMTKEARG